MKQGTVYWVTGLSGAGKTSVGAALYYQLQAMGESVIILDGDILKTIFEDDIDYSSGGRLKRAKKYSRLCKILSDCGVSVICCTIAMNEDVRQWNRSNIISYIEIFLDVPMHILKARDKKGVYSGAGAAVGEFGDYDYPKAPDLIFKNDGEMSVKEIASEIVNYRAGASAQTNDEHYWDEYYKEVRVELLAPSPFALEMNKLYLKSGRQILDLGCGNARDSVFFADKGLHVTAIDSSLTAIENNIKHYGDKNIVFICDDFSTANIIYQKKFDYCYSRFTLHAITEKQENVLIDHIYSTLVSGGAFFIEARSTHDELYGKGEEISRNRFFYNGHMRRFIDIEELTKKLEEKGFDILSAVEGQGFAKASHEDPVVIRLVAQKQEGR